MYLEYLKNKNVLFIVRRLRKSFSRKFSIFKNVTLKETKETAGL